MWAAAGIVRLGPPARVGLGDAAGAAAASSWLSTPGNVPPEIQAQYQGALSSQQSRGAQDAASLAAQILGNPQAFFADPANEPKFMAVLAGAFTAAGQPEIGAAIELLDLGAHLLATAMQALGLLGSGGGCSHTGPPMTGPDILAAWGWQPTARVVWGVPLPAPAPFAVVTMPIFAALTARLVSCDQSGPPIPWSVAAAAAWWNQGKTDLVTVYVPPYLGPMGGSSTAALDSQSGNTDSDALRLGLPWAFMPADQVPQAVWDSDTWNLGGSQTMQLSASGPDLTAAPPPPTPWPPGSAAAAGGGSALATVALFGVGLAGAGALAAGITAYATRRTVGQVLRGWWTAAGGRR